MITIFAEKPDMGTKIAAALDGITLKNGKKVSFEQISFNEKQIKAQRAEQGYFKINYQGQPTYVTWGYGHLCELKQAQDYCSNYKNWKNLPLPYIPESYELKLAPNAEKQYKVVKDLFCRSNLIICATDNDREGDLIFDNIYQYMQCKVPFQRALFNKQAKDEYLKAFSKDHLVGAEERQPVIAAGRARSAGDFIVGAGPTVALTLQNPCIHGVLSVGRVQTATLNILVQRELEIRNFKPKDYWVLKGKFQLPNGEFYIGTHESKRITEREKAKALLDNLMKSDRMGEIKSCRQKKFQKGKPHLYSLDTLQMDANKMYGFSLEKTLKLAQSLYEKGYTTYPRTDAVYLTNDMGKEMNRVLAMLFQIPDYQRFQTSTAVNPNDRYYFDSSKVESHYAIVPTTSIPKNMTEDEKKVYYLIALVTICMVYPNATLSKTEIETQVQGEKFLTSGTSIVEPGFFRVVGAPRESLLPAVTEGLRVYSLFGMESKKTEPPKRYTAATLLNAMLNCGKTLEDSELKKLMANGPGGKPRGLGRPSSRASIVETLEKRGYTVVKGKTIYPTDRGMTMIERFPVEDLKSAEMTAHWEKRLDDIEHGTDSYSAFMKDLEDSVRKWTGEIMEHKAFFDTKSSSSFQCPLCNSPLRDMGWGFACTKEKNADCNFSIGRTILGKTISNKQFELLFQKGETEVINGFKSKKGSTFSASLAFLKESNTVEFRYPQVDPSFLCPLCGSPLRKIKYGYGCSSFQSAGCPFTIGIIAKKTLTEQQIKELLSGKTVTVKGMKAGDGRTFSAGVFMDRSGRLELVRNQNGQSRR